MSDPRTLAANIETLADLINDPQLHQRMGDGRGQTREPLPDNVRRAVLRRDHYRCGDCNRSGPYVYLQVDHIVPVAAGGTDRTDNLRTLCEPCNMAKSNFKTLAIAWARPMVIVVGCEECLGMDFDDRDTVVWCACHGGPTRVSADHATKWEISHRTARAKARADLARAAIRPTIRYEEPA